MQASTFKAKTWAEIGDELFAQVGKRFALDQLTGKFNRLCILHREFSDLLEHTGFGWDPVSNTVTASPDVWVNYLQKKPKMKKFRLKGLAHYETLGEICNTTTATGQMHYASGQVPQNSDEERQLEHRFLNTGVHVKIHDKVDDVDVINIDGECDGGKGKRKSTTDAPSSYDRKPKKWEKMERYLDVCSEVMAEKLKRQKDKSTSELPGYEDTRWPEYQLRQIYDLVPLAGPVDKLKWFQLICGLCGSVVGCIQEGSNLQDCRATHQHASCHRDVLLDLPTGINQCHVDTSMAPRLIPYRPEAELLRIYMVCSYSRGYRRSAAPPSEEPVWYGVVCKVCEEEVCTTQDYPSLKDNHWLQKHALMHSEYLSMDGPTVPEPDYYKELLNPEGLIVHDDAPLQEGFVKICRRCRSENCSSGVYRAVMMDYVVCNESGTHLSWNCPTGNWEPGRPPTPCNRSD